MFLNGINGRRLTVSTAAPAVRQDEGDQPNVLYPIHDYPPFTVGDNVIPDLTTITISIAAKQRGSLYASASIMRGLLVVDENNELQIVFISSAAQGEGGYPFEVENPGPLGAGIWKYVLDIVDQRIRIRVQDTAGSGIIDWKAGIQIGL